MKKNKSNILGILSWLPCVLFFLYEFLLRTVVGTFQDKMMYDLKLNIVQFAFLSSTSYQIAYGLMQIPAGIITYSFGVRKTIFCAIICSIISTIGFALSNNLYIALIFRIMMGLGSSFAFICVLITIYEWLPINRTALFSGLSLFIGTIGAMLSAGPINYIADIYNITWRYMFILFAVIGVLILLLARACVKNDNLEKNNFIILNSSSTLDIFHELSTFIKQKQVWYIALFSSFIYFILEYLAENSGKSFLLLKGYDSQISSYMITIAWLGYAIGCPISGILSDIICRRKLIILIHSIIYIISILLIIFSGFNTFILIIAFLFLGLGASGQNLGFSIMAEQCNKNNLFIGLAFNNCFITFISAINAPIIGFLFSLFSYNHVYNLYTYYKAFGITVFISIIILMMAIYCIKETFCKSVMEVTKLDY